MQPSEWLGLQPRPVDALTHIESIRALEGSAGIELLGRLASGRAVRLRIEAARTGVVRIQFGPVERYGGRNVPSSPGHDSKVTFRPVNDPPGAESGPSGFAEIADALKGPHRFTANGLRLTVSGDPFRLQIEEAVSGQLFLKTADGDTDVMLRTRVPGFALQLHAELQGALQTEQAVMGLAVGPDEAFFGLGEQFGPLNLRGRRVQLLNLDAMGVGTDAAYKNVPFVLSSRGYGLFWNTYARMVHDVAYPQTSLYSYRVVSDEPVFDLWFFYGPSPGEVLRRYTELTGRPEVPPLWAFGLWMSRCWYETQEEVETVAARMKAERLPCDVLVLDGRAWLDLRTRCDFQFDRTRYPEPESLVADLRALGIRVCLWEYPYVSVHSRLFPEAASKGYLLRDSSGKPYMIHFPKEAFNQQLTAFPDSGIVDFTNPEAVQWYQELHRPLFQMGVSVFKTDFGEQVPPDAVASNGLTGSALHNAYALLYNEAVYEATRRFTGEPVVWARSGWACSQRFPIHWGGDPPATWDGLAATIRGGLSLSLSGFSYWSHDIGGFYGPKPSQELYIRWTQFGVFSPFARFHGTTPREPWYYGEEAMSIFRKYAKIRYRLIPYLVAAAWESNRSGLPMMRAVILEAPDQEVAKSADLEYLLGSDLLVAPLTRPGGARRVYLPPGTWIDVWEGRIHRGPTHIDVVVPLDRIPVFARGESVIPLGRGAIGEEIPHVGEATWKPVRLEYFADPQTQSGDASVEVWAALATSVSERFSGEAANDRVSVPVRYHLKRDGSTLSLWQTGTDPWTGWLRWHGIDVEKVERVWVNGQACPRMDPFDPGASLFDLEAGKEGSGVGWHRKGRVLSIPVHILPGGVICHVEVALAAN
ncbi:glycoside hydrolase family 31 protein [Limnochorda pilosa]|uniref:Uncharacterized protein n=1 Tax=Limnochorda pilosa TaxID=1555112 RepID=A0A0K2SGP6_LIMPI|nr:glycoside hydrolase family 31 protein [Limnochorda pilosa]BAS26283.1 hypothetical protein LIP_0426 [Limnochorda pilosa]